jgi:hypothetical protein
VFLDVECRALITRVGQSLFDRTLLLVTGLSLERGQNLVAEAVYIQLFKLERDSKNRIILDLPPFARCRLPLIIERLGSTLLTDDKLLEGSQRTAKLLHLLVDAHKIPRELFNRDLAGLCCDIQTNHSVRTALPFLKNGTLHQAALRRHDLVEPQPELPRLFCRRPLALALGRRVLPCIAGLSIG